MTARSSMPAPETSSPSRANPAVESDESDEEDAFMRNKPSNSSNRWKELQLRNQRAKEAQSAIEISDSSSSASDGDEDGTPKPKKKTKAKGKAPALPAWTKRPPKPAARIITSSDEDDVVVLQDLNTSPSARTKGKNRKRSRSRSRSLTPPPELTAEEKARAKAIVEGALHIGPPAKKQKTPPIDVDDFDFNFATSSLNPELAMIAKRVMARPAAAAKPVLARATVTVKVTVQWVSHPVNEPHAPVRQWSFNVSRSETFATSLLPKIVEVTGVKDIVLSYDTKRVFRTSSPESLGLWSEADLHVYTPQTWEYISTHRDELSADPVPETPATAAGHDEATPGPSEDEHEDSFMLILRAQNIKDVNLRVKPTATASRVVAAYLKKVPQGSSLSAAKKKAVHLVFEGEKVAPDTTLAQLEVEDEDVLDVRGI
ncbi:hypothetical protein AURDEDRAFT_111953 [Auricularia subglabra TFB-10046 SS5]|nr:hypothetical protein AURDEDRAFT_111953 [Auricularia subglabra TFB-10046 SS5]